MSRQDHTGLLSQHREEECACVWSPVVARQRDGGCEPNKGYNWHLSSSKTHQPSSALCQALSLGEGTLGETQPRGCQLMQKCQGGSCSQRFMSPNLSPVGVAGMSGWQGRALLPGRTVRRVIERNIFRGKPDWSPVFSYMSLSQEMDQGS